jgi:hypothetical protein
MVDIKPLIEEVTRTVACGADPAEVEAAKAALVAAFGGTEKARATVEFYARLIALIGEEEYREGVLWALDEVQKTFGRLAEERR